jgi:hypothetical protein
LTAIVFTTSIGSFYKVASEGITSSIHDHHMQSNEALVMDIQLFLKSNPLFLVSWTEVATNRQNLN